MSRIANLISGELPLSVVEDLSIANNPNVGIPERRIVFSTNEDRPSIDISYGNNLSNTLVCTYCQLIYNGRWALSIRHADKTYAIHEECFFKALSPPKITNNPDPNSPLLSINSSDPYRYCDYCSQSYDRMALAIGTFNIHERCLRQAVRALSRASSASSDEYALDQRIRDLEQRIRFLETLPKS